jgi:hypothetical protein
MRTFNPKALALSSLFACAYASAQPAAAQEISNSDVYVTVTELADEVELIREVMGRPFDDSPRLPVSGIGLFELYMQTETLLLRSNRLASELAGTERISAPPVPAVDPSPAAILMLVEVALGDIRRVRNELGITEAVIREDRGTPIAATGVFSVVLDTNRQLNLLLDDPFDSADVHGRLVMAAMLAAGILNDLGRSSPASAVSTDPRLPVDVLRNLLDCLSLAADVARAAGVDTLTVSARRNVPPDVTPGHVYDVAQFLVADLILIARRRGASSGEIDLGPVPRHIFPAQTYVVSELIVRQLQAIRDAL